MIRNSNKTKLNYTFDGEWKYNKKAYLNLRFMVIIIESEDFIEWFKSILFILDEK